MTAPREDVAALMLSRSTPEPNTGCWLWMGPYDPKGYAMLWVDGKRHRASRMVLGLRKHEKRYALHSCDTPECVNPDHLRIGTIRENALDAVKRSIHPFYRRQACPQGHAYGEGNVLWRTDARSGRRYRRCRLCRQQEVSRGNPRRKERYAERKRMKKGAAAAAIRAEAVATERAKWLAVVRDAIEGERLTDGTGHPMDEGYNSGIRDALAALDRVAQRIKEEGV